MIRLSLHTLWELAETDIDVSEGIDYFTDLTFSDGTEERLAPYYNQMTDRIELVKPKENIMDTKNDNKKKSTTDQTLNFLISNLQAVKAILQASKVWVKKFSK